MLGCIKFDLLTVYQTTFTCLSLSKRSLLLTEGGWLMIQAVFLLGYCQSMFIVIDYLDILFNKADVK